MSKIFKLLPATFISISLFFWSCEEGYITDDNESPIVQLTLDFSGDSVSDTIMVSAMATDNYGVERCELWIDGSFTGLTSNAEPFIFLYNTRLLSNGSHNLVVRAYDFSGNYGDSPAAPMLTNNDFDNPEISIEYSYIGDGFIEVEFEVYDESGVDSVLLYIDGLLSNKTYSNRPFTFNVNTKNYDNVEHYIYGIAYDPYGYSAVSDTLNIAFYNTPEMYLETTNSTVSVGDMFSADIIVERFPPIFAMTMQLSYNDSLFTINESTGFESGDFFGSNSIEFFNIGSSRVYITKSLVQGDTPVSGFGTIGSINFSAEAVGQDTLKLVQIYLYDSNGDEINPSFNIPDDLIISVE